jgi:hypothetical protein
MGKIKGIEPFEANYSDTIGEWWDDAWVNQNLTFPVQFDPINGQHCGHRHVKVTKV